MPILNFLAQSVQDSDNIQAAPGRLVNYYRERVGDRFVLKSVPGMSSFCNLNDVIGRAMREVNGRLFAASGGALYQIDSNGSPALLGAIADDEVTTMAGYDENVMITANGTYYLYNGTTLSSPGSGALTSVGSVAFVSGYTVLTEKDGDQFEWTDLRDPSSRNALNVARAESRDDTLLRAMEFGGNLYLFGKKSLEIWGLSGDAGANAFSRLSGGGSNRGLLGANLVTSIGNALAFVGDDGLVYVLAGTASEVISSVGVNTAIKESTPTHVFFYDYEGHKFLVVRFSDRPAWVYDIAMTEWHERASGLDLDEWNVIAAERAFGKALFLDRTSIVSEATGTNDLGATLLRVAVSDTLELPDRDDFVVSRIEARARAGFQASDAKIMMRISRDRGVTWTDAKERSIGTTGQYRDRAVWRGQGLAHALNVELSQSTDADIPLFCDVRADVA